MSDQVSGIRGRGSELRLGTLCYAVQDQHVLLIRRAREPHRGLWVAPGGKLEAGESPHEGVIREMREETGLRVSNPQLRGVVTEVSARSDYQWLLFLFRADRFEGDLRAGTEGELAWVSLTDIPHLPMPESDATWYAHIVAPGSALFIAKYTYDADLRVTGWQRY